MWIKLATSATFYQSFFVLCLRLAWKEGLDVPYLDTCHSKASKFRGLHAVLARFDKNKKVTIVGWAVVPAETYEYSMQVFAKWYSYKDESGKPLLASWLNDPTSKLCICQSLSNPCFTVSFTFQLEIRRIPDGV